MELETSRVYRNLEMKLKIAGFDAFDFLLILLFSGIMNLIFGGTALGIYFVFILPGLIMAVLYFGKRNKPEGFLKRFIRFYFLPACFKAGESENQRRKEKIYHG